MLHNFHKLGLKYFTRTSDFKSGGLLVSLITDKDTAHNYLPFAVR